MAACLQEETDVLFTDIMLPGARTGWDIAERCRESKPDLPVIYATGHSQVDHRPMPGSIIFKNHTQ